MIRVGMRSDQGVLVLQKLFLFVASTSILATGIASAATLSGHIKSTGVKVRSVIFANRNVCQLVPDVKLAALWRRNG